MTSFAARAAQTLPILLRATLILLALAAPVLAVPTFRAVNQTIEAPTMRKGSGVGFVLLVSLQRG
ncbi:MAG TPA: hypothetical protein VGM46_14155 [Mesorhizobium sp.]|jgi:hypothetical protein